MALPEKCPLCCAGIALQSVVTSHVYGAKKESNSAFFHCGSCDVRYQYPGLTPEEEAQFYAAEFGHFMTSRSGSQGGWQKAEEHVLANEKTRLRRMKYISPHLRNTSKILEVGCSSGFMLYPLVETGHCCTGIEPSGTFRGFIEKQGLPVYESLEYFNKGFSGSFDLIFHFFVLEHIAQPIPFLEAQLQLLKPGGKIIFEIPNSADPLYSVYNIPAFEHFYWSVAHPWYFSEISLKYLLNQLNHPYTILRDQRYDLSNHMIWARDSRPGGMGRFTYILGHELEESYKQALIKVGRCDTLVGIITKE